MVESTRVMMSTESSGQQKEILVTGGAGYIGSHAVQALSEAGYRVVVYDNMENGHLEALNAAGDFALFQADLLDKETLEACFKNNRFQGVLHFAGLALVGESVQDPERYYGTNVTGGLNLLNACKRHNVKNFVFSSTCSTYGVPEKVPISEEHPQYPINPYGRTKYAFEHALYSYKVAHDINFLAFRYFNAAGADPNGGLGEDHQPESHLIPNAFKVALGKLDHLTIHGKDYPTPDGTCIRDYIHVTDLVKAHVVGLEYLMKGGESQALNLGTGVGHSVLEVVKACEAASGKPIPCVEGERRPGDPPELVANAEKARNLIGFAPERSDLKTICEDAWRWFSAHPNGYAGKPIHPK